MRNPTFHFSQPCFSGAGLLSACAGPAITHNQPPSAILNQRGPWSPSTASIRGRGDNLPVSATTGVRDYQTLLSTWSRSSGGPPSTLGAIQRRAATIQHPAVFPNIQISITVRRQTSAAGLFPPVVSSSVTLLNPTPALNRYQSSECRHRQFISTITPSLTWHPNL